MNSPNVFRRVRTSVATTAAKAATAASRVTGRGAGGMIGGLVANAIDPSIMEQLGKGRPTVLVTGTNGKSTTTRMLASAVRAKYAVATNDGGDNMDAGIISALMAEPEADAIVLEVDELHVPSVADRLKPDVLVLLNLTRDQLDRVGEVSAIEKALRETVAKHPDMLVIANCDDVLMTSVAWDAPNVVWVSAGAGWLGDSVTAPRSGHYVVRHRADWYAVEGAFRRPTPTWSVTEAGFTAPSGSHSLSLKLPGRANRGNAVQAIAAAVEGFGVPIEEAISAAESVDNVGGRYKLVEFEGHTVRLLLAKNPAGWQEALSMIDRSAEGLVIAINGQQGDGEDMSWLWDVELKDFSEIPVVAAGERSTDLSVRLTYADITHERVPDALDAIRSLPKGRIEVLANYSAFRDLNKELND